MTSIIPSAADIAELAPTGRLRAAINYGNPVLAQRSAADGAPSGVSVDLARELGRELNVPVELVPFDAAGKVFEAAKASRWDVAFLAVDPVRAAEIDFTAPYVVIEGTYLVRAASPLRAMADFDRAGVRIAVGRGAAYDLFLSRSLKQAELVRADTSGAALDLFAADHLDAAAGVKQQLEAFVQAHAGYRIIPGNFTEIRQAMGTPRGRLSSSAYLAKFVERMKRSGFVAAALERSGRSDAAVAPPA